MVSLSEPGHWFESDPLWFKRAVFYELHTRGFFDGNDDGSGDLRGVTGPLDHLAWLRLAEARLVRLVGHGPALPGRPDHLHRHRAGELDMGPDRGSVLLAPLLLAPARPELRQPRGAGGDADRSALLARPRHRRFPPRR